MQEFNPIIISIWMQIINFRNMIFQNFLRAKNTWRNENIQFCFSQINALRFCFFDNDMFGVYVFALNVVRFRDNFSLRSNECRNFSNRCLAMVSEKIQTSDNRIFNLGIITLCQYLFGKKTRAGATHIFFKKNNFNIWKFIINQMSTIFSIPHRLFRKNIVSRLNNFQIFFVVRWFVQNQNKINKAESRDNFSTPFLAYNGAIESLANPNCFVCLNYNNKWSSNFATFLQIAKMPDMEQIKNATDERSCMWLKRLLEFREGS